jgi:hypothetical protein
MNVPSARMNEVVDHSVDFGQAHAERPLAAALLLMLDRPSAAVGGDAGVGKTEVASACRRARKLIRLQCYEGLDVHTAMYDGITSASCWPSSCSSATNARSPSKSRTFSEHIC